MGSREHIEIFEWIYFYLFSSCSVSGPMQGGFPTYCKNWNIQVVLMKKCIFSVNDKFEFKCSGPKSFKFELLYQWTFWDWSVWSGPCFVIYSICIITCSNWNILYGLVFKDLLWFSILGIGNVSQYLIWVIIYSSCNLDKQLLRDEMRTRESSDIEGLGNSLLCDKTIVRAAVHWQQLSQCFYRIILSWRSPAGSELKAMPPNPLHTSSDARFSVIQ